MPLVSGFYRGSPVLPALSFRCCFILTTLTLIGSQDLDVKSHPNFFTHSSPFPSPKNGLWSRVAVCRYRAGNGGFGGRRKPTKPQQQQPQDELREAESAEGRQETSPSTAKPGFSRSRFGSRPSRGGVSPASTTEHSTSDASSSASSPASTKPVFPERHTPRRRPGLRPSFTTAAPTSEETKSDGEETNEPATASESSPVSTTATIRPAPGGRPRISLGGGNARPLRPGPRINIGGRPRPGAASSTTTAAPPPPAPEASDSGSDEQPAAPEDAAPETSELAHEFDCRVLQEAVSTAAPDALTRLRNRPRLRVTERAPKSTPAPVSGRRNLVSSLLPRRRPQQPQPEAAPADPEPADEEQGETAEESESIEKEETAPPPASEAAPSSESPPEGGRLSSLLAGRRRAGLPRRPGTLFPSSAGRAAPSSKEAA
ncbi:hypothetical protein PR048_022883 [Dryococelus australis]|uniref:Uncharacterized protein n=1 Tax=Dryococelus australis TaxID=614101 RepID=A0ABQ9GSK4_9NEOP|nr:hypothetical protein PR048_022883 [Dryococelus australis]